MILNGITPGIPGQVAETFIPLVTQVPSGMVLIPRVGTVAALAPGADVLMTGPMVIHGFHTISALSCYIETAGTGSSVVRLGIYNNDPVTGKPGTLLVDAGTAAATSTGAKTITGLSTPITPGLYWVAAVFQTVTGALQMTAGNGAPIVPYHFVNYQGHNSGYQQSGVTGALGPGPYAFGTFDTRLPAVGLTV